MWQRDPAFRFVWRGFFGRWTPIPYWLAIVAVGVVVFVLQGIYFSWSFSAYDEVMNSPTRWTNQVLAIMDRAVSLALDLRLLLAASLSVHARRLLQDRRALDELLVIPGVQPKLSWALLAVVGMIALPLGVLDVLRWHISYRYWPSIDDLSLDLVPVNSAAAVVLTMWYFELAMLRRDTIAGIVYATIGAALYWGVCEWLGRQGGTLVGPMDGPWAVLMPAFFAVVVVLLAKPVGLVIARRLDPTDPLTSPPTPT